MLMLTRQERERELGLVGKLRIPESASTASHYYHCVVSLSYTHCGPGEPPPPPDPTFTPFKKVCFLFPSCTQGEP